jgi:ATP-dependent exoDNAse (exonuclease V) alpha subunit
VLRSSSRLGCAEQSTLALAYGGTEGSNPFEVIEQEPGRLREVTGIGPKRAERIVSGWAEQKVIREIMLFLHSNGVGTSRAVRIYKTYGAEAVQLISENPYRLARDIRGIGFRTADQIAAKLGIEKTALIRVRAGIAYALTEAMDEGHCGLPAEELISLTQTLLEVPAELVEAALGLELEGGAIIADDLEGRRCVFLAGLYRAEREIAEKLNALANGRPPWPAIDADKAIPWVEQRTKLALACSQREAVRVALASKVLGDHRRSRRRQDDSGQLDLQDLERQGRHDRALCAHRPCRQAPLGEIDCAVGSNSRASSSGERPARSRSTIWWRNSGG